MEEGRSKAFLKLVIIQVREPACPLVQGPYRFLPQHFLCSLLHLLFDVGSDNLTVILALALCALYLTLLGC